MSPESLNAELIAYLKQQNLITRAEIERAFHATPRHVFLPNVDVQDAYKDRAIATKFEGEMAISSCSQPAIIAIMLEQLDVREDMNVLEIGAGTGYNAALLSRIVGTRGHVTTLDIDEDIVRAARAHLQSAGVSNVDVICADGGDGYAPHAPYDRIILSVGAWDISPAWLMQLRLGGVLVLPLWFGARQYAIAFEKVNAHLRSRSIQPCGFMALRGNFAGPRVWQVTAGYIVGGECVERLDINALRGLLAQPPRSRLLPTSDINLSDLLDAAAAHDEPVISLMSRQHDKPVALAYGIAAASDSLALLVAKDMSTCEPTTTVMVYGSDSAWDALQQRMVEFVSAGRPSIARGTIVAYPRDHAPAANLALEKRWMTYVFAPTYKV